MTSKILQKGYLLVGRNELGEEKFLTHTNPFGWYSDYNYFARIFKKHFGISPGQFKKICYNKKAESY